MTRSIGILMALTLAIVLTAVLGAPVAAETGITTAPEDFAPGQIVVKVSSGPFGVLADSVLESLGLKTVSRLDQIGYRLVQVPLGQEKRLAEVVRGLPLVSYAGTNGVVRTLETPDDPYLGQQWAPGKMNLYQAWDVMTGTSSVKIAIVDTGVSPTHPDLIGKIVTGTRILSGTEYPGEYADDQGHGTHVAGIAAASTNNGVGVAGVNWNAEVLPVKVLYGTSGKDYDAAMGVIRAADMGAQIINCSWGGTLSDTIPVDAAILCAATDYALSKGSLVVVAAGNGGSSVPYYPAACSSAVAVGSTGSLDTRSSFSSYGPHLWVTAPGENIYSTVWQGYDSYGTKSGTSMATPQVSGVASLVLSTKPWLSPYWLKYILKVSVVDLGTPGFDNEYGWGRVDARSALSHTAEITRVLAPTISRLE